MMAEFKEVPQVNLHSKMAAIRGAIGSMKKTGRNKSQNYDFHTADDIYSNIRKALSEHQIDFYPNVRNYTLTEFTTSGGKTGYHFVLEMEFVFVCAETGQSFTCSWVSESIDYADKGVNQAITSGTKYFLITAFLVSASGEDADAKTPEVGQSRRSPSKITPIGGESVDEKIEAVWKMVNAVFKKDRDKFDAVADQIDWSQSVNAIAPQMVNAAKQAS